MLTITIKNMTQDSNRWAFFSDPGNEVEIYARGYVFADSQYLPNSESIAEYLKNCLINTRSEERFEVFRKTVAMLNGVFAVAVKMDNCIFAAVDRLRSIPLFYSLSPKSFTLSDEASQVRKKIESREVDDIALKEFLLTGYVTGNDTLYKGVRQIQAGECIAVSHTDVPSIKRIRYYRYCHSEYFEQPVKELYSHAKKMLTHVFERFAQTVRGHQIVVPLSGGLDSRLIVTMLRLMGIENVICFSYGKKGNWESEISKRVAKKLGYNWEFVLETKEKWQKLHETDQCKRFYSYAHNLSSSVHLQDWPAIRELKRKEKIEPDAIVVPGHSGDFLAGSHLSPAFNQMDRVGKNALINIVLKKHYHLWDWSKSKEWLYPVLESRILSCIDGFPLNAPQDVATAFESWDWQERQAKFIINSLRVYEFWGYEWRMPLWDNEMMDFFSHMPLKYRIGKEFYDFFLNNFYFNKLGLDMFPDVNIPVCKPLYPVRDGMGNLVPSRLIGNLPQIIRHYSTLSRPPEFGMTKYIDVLRLKRFYKYHFGAKYFENLLELSINTHMNFHTYNRIVEGAH